MAEEGFFSRWSRRKADERLGRSSDDSAATRSADRPAGRPDRFAPPAGAPGNATNAALGDVTALDSAAPRGVRVAGDPVLADTAGMPGVSTAPPPPILDDARKLAPGSNVAAYLDRRVDEATRRLALKRLFADPHFNQMDGLDVYIDDYSIPDPIPEEMLREMHQAHSLGLFDEPAMNEAGADAMTSEAAADGDGASPVEARSAAVADAGAASEPVAGVSEAAAMPESALAVPDAGATAEPAVALPETDADTAAGRGHGVAS